MTKHYKYLIIFLMIITAALIWWYRTSFIPSIPLEYQPMVHHYAEEYQLDTALVYAVIKTESNFDPNARSHRDAYGLMQITEDTLKWALVREGKQFAYTADDLQTPEINIKYGCFILRLFLDEFDDVDTALAAYNAGRSNALKWLKDKRYSEDGIHLHTTPFNETNNYIKKVLKYREKYQKTLGEST